jgi:hypothetical protein
MSEAARMVRFRVSSKNLDAVCVKKKGRKCMKKMNKRTFKCKHVQVAEGTLGYAAPEQMQFHNGSPKSDIYSLGATIIYFATGENPYENKNDRNYILTQFTMGNPMPVSESVEVCGSPSWKCVLHCIDSLFVWHDEYATMYHTLEKDIQITSNVA